MEQLSLAFGLVGVVGFVIATLALIEIKALKASTHKIQWMPLDTGSSLNDKSGAEEDNKEVMSWDDDDLVV